MFAWGNSGQGAAPARAAPAGARPDAILRLMLNDTADWQYDWAVWRVRFAPSPHAAGAGPGEIASLLRAHALPLCAHGGTVSGDMLYLRAEDDLAPLFRVFGGHGHGVGRIAIIQSRDAYDDAQRVAALLLAAPQPAEAREDPLALPDLQWQVTGHDQFRVARTRVRGHEVVVRFGLVAGHEMWVIDVDGRPGCAQFRTRADAMSKLGIAAALAGFDNQSKR